LNTKLMIIGNSTGLPVVFQVPWPVPSQTASLPLTTRTDQADGFRLISPTKRNPRENERPGNQIFT